MKAALAIVLLALQPIVALAGDHICVVANPRQSLVIHCLDKDLVSKDPGAKDALDLGLSCNRRGRDDCLSVFPNGRLNGGLELTRGGEKLVVARPKTATQLRIFKGAVLAAKKIKVRPSDSVLVTEQGGPVSDSDVSAASW